MTRRGFRAVFRLAPDRKRQPAPREASRLERADRRCRRPEAPDQTRAIRRSFAHLRAAGTTPPRPEQPFMPSSLPQHRFGRIVGPPPCSGPHRRGFSTVFRLAPDRKRQPAPREASRLERADRRCRRPEAPDQTRAIRRSFAHLRTAGTTPPRRPFCNPKAANAIRDAAQPKPETRNRPSGRHKPTTCESPPRTAACTQPKHATENRAADTGVSFRSARPPERAAIRKRTGIPSFVRFRRPAPAADCIRAV